MFSIIQILDLGFIWNLSFGFSVRHFTRSIRSFCWAGVSLGYFVIELFRRRIGSGIRPAVFGPKKVERHPISKLSCIKIGAPFSLQRRRAGAQTMALFGPCLDPDRQRPGMRLVKVFDFQLSVFSYFVIALFRYFESLMNPERVQ